MIRGQEAPHVTEAREQLKAEYEAWDEESKVVSTNRMPNAVRHHNERKASLLAIMSGKKPSVAHD